MVGCKFNVMIGQYYVKHLVSMLNLLVSTSVVFVSTSGVLRTMSLALVSVSVI